MDYPGRKFQERLNDIIKLTREALEWIVRPRHKLIDDNLRCVMVFDSICISFHFALCYFYRRYFYVKINL